MHPSGLLLARYFGLGLIGLWYGNMIGLCVYAITGFAWIYRLDWKQMALESRRFTHVQFERAAEAF